MHSSAPSPSLFVFKASAVPVSVTGTVAETVLATITIPAGLLGPNDQVEVMALWSHTNSANNKTLKLTFGGQNAMAIVNTTLASQQTYTRISNRNSLSSQIVNGNSASGFGNTNAAAQALTVNTAGDVAIVFAAILANTGETITLESYSIKIVKGV